MKTDKYEKDLLDIDEQFYDDLITIEEAELLTDSARDRFIKRAIKRASEDRNA